MWFRRRAMKGLDDDIRDHIARETEDNIARGMAPGEARRQALVRFGNVALAKEDTRAVWAWGWLEQFVQDARYALRTLARNRGFAAISILTLSLGIGATTAIFSIADAALVRPALYPNPERVVQIHLALRNPSASDRFMVDGRPIHSPSAGDFQRWQAATRSLDSVATSETDHVAVQGHGMELETVPARAMSDGYLRVYGIHPILGRPFAPQDQEPNAPPVALLGYNFWRNHLAGDRAVLGTVLRLADGHVTVVGVLPPSLFPSVAMWRPMGVAALNPLKPRSLSVVARLRPGVSRADAQAELAALTPAESPMRPRPGSVTPFVVPEVREYESQMVWILLGAVTCVLLIACVNVAGLQLARGASRQQELATRASLGAGRWRLFRLLLTESLILASFGGLLGIGLAWLSLDALLSILPLEFSVRPVSLNLVVLTFAVGVTIVSGLAFGLVPAVRLSAARVGAHSLSGRMGQRTVTASRRTGRILIGAEIALALILVSGSSLMIRTLLQVHAVDLGFDPGRFVALNVRFVDRSGGNDDYAVLFERVRLLPGLATVGAVSFLPLGGEASRGADLRYLDGTPTPKPEQGWDTREFQPGYFDAIGMRRLAGQWPSTADCTAEIPPLVVNESAARRLFPSTAAVGRQIMARGTVHHIAAVTADVRHSGPQVNVVSEIYFCRDDPAGFAGNAMITSTIVVQPQRGTEVRGLLRAAVLGMGERVTDIQIRSGDELFADVTAPPRRRTLLLTILGGLGLALAMVGVFGMTTYAVARRTREIGIRMAFGARPVDAVLAIVRDAAFPGAIGLALGLAAAFFSAPVLSTFLFHTTPHDPSALGSAVAALALAGLLAAWIPARRAARINPVAALRAE